MYFFNEFFRWVLIIFFIREVFHGKETKEGQQEEKEDQPPQASLV